MNFKKLPWLGVFGGNFLFFPDALDPFGSNPDWLWHGDSSSIILVVKA
jgi:hypothetical protein